jgi:phosphoglucosamine mutase
VVDFASGRNRYMGYLISLATHSYKDKRVGLDCANGSTWQMAKNIFETLGAEVKVIGDAPNGMNINDGCGSTHIEALRQLVLENKLDVGFAFDGDADRCIAVDETGRIIDGDLILYIYGKYMKDREKLAQDTVVTTIMSNFGLYKAFDRIGIKYAKTDVGDKYVYECMRQNGYLIGGEQSGHIIFTKYSATGDGLLTAIKLMQAMLANKQPLSVLASPVTIYPQLLKNVRVSDKDAAINNEAVQKASKEAEEALEGNGRILLRKSGTEPVVRVMAEAPTNEACTNAVDHIINAMRAEGLVKG